VVSARDASRAADGWLTCSVDLAVLAVVLLAVLWFPLGNPPVFTHGEAREGLVVQDIVQKDDWILPFRAGELPSKPLLFHWISAGLAHIAGPSDRTLRLPSALAAILMACCTMLLGRAAGGRAVGWLSAGALIGTVQFWESATEARVDMVLSAAVVLSLTGFYFWYGHRRAAARAVCYLAAAAAVLAKGPVGAVLPALIIFVFLAWQRELKLLRELWSWPLVLAVIVIDVGWYACATGVGGKAFLAKQIGYENFDRFVGRGAFADSGHRDPLDMPLAMLRHLLPWNLVLLAAVWQWVRGGRTDASGRFLHSWWMATLVFFSLAVGERSVYLLPLFPAIAVLAGRALPVAALRVRASLETRRGGAARAFFVERPLAAFGLCIALLDLSILSGVQISHWYRARYKSLLPFVADVQRTVGPADDLVADESVRSTVLYVLRYRLDRPIALRTAGDEIGTYRLASGSEAEDLAGRGYQLLASSHSKEGSVALLRLGPRQS